MLGTGGEFNHGKWVFFGLVAPNRLRILLTGDQKEPPYTETFDLRRSA